MYFPQFLVGMLVTSFVAAIWTGVETGSGWVALGWAVLTLVVLQVGYVVLIIRLMLNQIPKTGAAASTSAKPAPPLRGDGVSL